MPGHAGDSNAAGGWQKRSLTPWPAAMCSHISPPSLRLAHLPAPSFFSLPLQVLFCLARLLSDHLLQEECLSTLLPELPQLTLPGASVSLGMKGDQNCHIMGFTSSKYSHECMVGTNYWYCLPLPPCGACLLCRGSQQDLAAYTHSRPWKRLVDEGRLE